MDGQSGIIGNLNEINGLKAKQGLMVLRDTKTKNVVLGLI